MTTDRSDGLYQTYLESLQRFDYFISGVSIALVGYLGSRIGPIRPAFDSRTLELVALASLLVSAGSSLKRTETVLDMLRVMYRRLRYLDAAADLTKIVEAGRPGIDPVTAKVVFPGQAISERSLSLANQQKATERLEELSQLGSKWYRARNFFLVLGLVLILVSKVVAGYEEPANAPHNQPTQADEP